MPRTIYERYGGFAFVHRVVTSFYDKVLDSPVTSQDFVDVDMRRLIDHQTKFVASVLGGPASYTTDQLARVHARLGITEPAFLEVVALLVETLEEHSFTEDDKHVVVDEIMACRHVIITKAA
jgi:hemoglobin